MKSVAVDISGQRFGRLLVVERGPKLGDSKRAAWRCVCECGKEAVVLGIKLRQGHKRSCGCLQDGEDLTGRSFGRWTVLSLWSESKPKDRRWNCRCECGTERVVAGDLLRGGDSQSCGCAHRVNWEGLRVGRLTVLRESGKNRHGQTMLLCRCECGVEKRIVSTALRRERPTLSCGCRKREVDATKRPSFKHGRSSKASGRPDPTYRTWLGMRGRCSNPSVHGYANYGGRGIRVCERWATSFENFLADMGPRPSESHSIDRIDPNGNYEPSNCRWATWKQQRHNQRLSPQRVVDVLAKYEAEAPDLIARLRRDLLG